MRLTYRGLGRPIRGVVQVAKSQVSGADGKGWLSQTASQYHYPTSSTSGVPLERFNALLQTKTGARVNA